MGHKPDEHAVVIGASVAGLLAARALSDSYAKVTVIERDELPGHPAPRRGVPQSKHLHVFLARGAHIFDDLFPGFTEGLEKAGAVRSDPQNAATYVLDGRPIAAAPSGLNLFGVSRALLEFQLRRRVTQQPNVDIVSGRKVLGLLGGRGGKPVCGVHTDDPLTPGLPCDLVVDASGRGSRARTWLQDLGFVPPQTSRVDVNVVYVTRHYQWEPHHLDGRHGMLVVPYPGMPRGAGVVHMEDGKWGVVLFGLLGDSPPTGAEDMLVWADTLPVPDVAKLMREATPSDEAVSMRFPASVRWHYERQQQHVEGFLVMGDALASFNPTYGQGMSVAAMQAQVLGRLARSRSRGLPGRFYKRAAKAIDGAWALAVGGDLRFPEITGRRTRAGNMIAAYLDRYRLAATVDTVLARTFLRVALMVDAPAVMLAPGQLWRVWRGKRRASRRPA